MPTGAFMSKAIAGTFVVLTISAIGGLILMITFYQIELSKLKPTRRPTQPSTTVGPPPDMRLPKNLIPERYEIFIKHYLYPKIIEEVNVTSPNQTLKFEGNSTVHFLCVKGTSTIYLHSKQLNVSRPVLKNKDTNEFITVPGLIYHTDETDFLEIPLNQALETENNYSLFLAFEGELGNLEGAYVSSYHEGVPVDEGDTNSERFLVATNLEPTDARRVFPCFDEPDMKAVFDVTIIHRPRTTALGNAKMADSPTVDGWKVTSFYPTSKMSTYLFAFTVSELEKSAPSKHERVEIHIYARPEAIAAGHAEYAVNISGEILKFFENHFEIKYPDKKLDQIALPDLLPAGMENWGLVTYQEAMLLYEKDVSSLLHKETIASIIAHELAHQWFGNLVTMKWWNQIWLNEGFATYMSYFAVDHVENSFQIKDTLVVNDLHIAFSEDALASSRPLSAPQSQIQTTDEILSMFDRITYFKGAMVLRMLADTIGERVFNAGIKRYLQTFKYQNTDQNDLWEYIQKAVDDDKGRINVAEMMDSWTNQIGYPVITINTTDGTFYQKHFLFNNSAESSLWWHVPISVTSETLSGKSIVWLRTPAKVTNELFKSERGEWILANINCTGFYRVNYDQENWQRLLNQMETEPSRIPLMNRAQLIDDAFNLARAEIVDVTLALNTTRFLHNETCYLPWEATERNLFYFVQMFDRSEVYGPMQMYLQNQVKPLYNYFKNYTDYSKVPTDHSLQHNQIVAIEMACSNGLPECLEMATEMFADWMKVNGTNRIHPNLRSVIYCQAVGAGGKEEWEFAWEKFLSTKETSEKEYLRQALSCTKKIWLLNRYLKYTLDPEKIRLMDVASTIIYIARNVAGQALAWNFIRANWDYVSMGDTVSLILGVTSRFSTEFELQELQHFSTTYDLGPAVMAVEHAIEQTQVNIEWVNANKDNILEWFEGETST